MTCQIIKLPSPYPLGYIAQVNVRVLGLRDAWGLVPRIRGSHKRDGDSLIGTLGYG